MWHVSSRSGVATLRTAIHLLLTYLLTYLHTIQVSERVGAAVSGSGLRTGLVCGRQTESEVCGQPEPDTGKFDCVMFGLV